MLPLGILWSFITGIWPLLELQQGNLSSSRVVTGDLAFLLSCDGKLAIHLMSLQGNQASSIVEAGHLGFLSCFNGKFRAPLKV